MPCCARISANYNPNFRKFPAALNDSVRTGVIFVTMRERAVMLRAFILLHATCDDSKLARKQIFVCLYVQLTYVQLYVCIQRISSLQIAGLWLHMRVHACNILLTMFRSFISGMFHCNKETNKGLIKCAQGFQFIEHLLFAHCLSLVCSSSKASNAMKFRRN